MCLLVFRCRLLSAGKPVLSKELIIKLLISLKDINFDAEESHGNYELCYR